MIDYIQRSLSSIVFLLLFILFTFLSHPSSLPAVARVTAQPQQNFIERDAAGQYLNFDFVIENLKDDPLQISRIEVSVYDDQNKLAFRRAMDSGGFSPSVRTIPNREIAGKQSGLVFNPFPTFEPYIDLARVRFDFTFATKNGGKENKAEVVIAPTYYETKTNLTLPVKRSVQVASGHDFYAHHRRPDYLHPIARQLGFNRRRL
jgi:hypothetical protein